MTMICSGISNRTKADSGAMVTGASKGMTPSRTLVRVAMLVSRSICSIRTGTGTMRSRTAASVMRRTISRPGSYRTEVRCIRAWTIAGTSCSGTPNRVMTRRAYSAVCARPGMSTGWNTTMRVASRSHCS